MDPAALSLLAAAVVSLGLDRPVHPWGLISARGRIREAVLPPLPVVFEPILAPTTPFPCDLPPELVSQAFARQDRDRIAAPLDASFQALHVLRIDAREVDPETVVRAQFGVPLIGSDRCLVRVRATNLYRDVRGRTEEVVSDLHAWLDLEGRVAARLSPAQAALADAWPRWVPGRSPGLPARVDLNHASEAELANLPGLTRPMVRSILAGRPFAALEHVLERTKVGPRTLEKLRDWVEV